MMMWVIFTYRLVLSPSASVSLSKMNLDSFVKFTNPQIVTVARSLTQPFSSRVWFFSFSGSFQDQRKKGSRRVQPLGTLPYSPGSASTIPPRLLLSPDHRPWLYGGKQMLSDIIKWIIIIIIGAIVFAIAYRIAIKSPMGSRYRGGTGVEYFTR